MEEELALEPEDELIVGAREAFKKDDGDDGDICEILESVDNFMGEENVD